MDFLVSLHGKQRLSQMMALLALLSLFAIVKFDLEIRKASSNLKDKEVTRTVIEEIRNRILNYKHGTKPTLTAVLELTYQYLRNWRELGSNLEDMDKINMIVALTIRRLEHLPTEHDQDDRVEVAYRLGTVISEFGAILPQVTREL